MINAGSTTASPRSGQTRTRAWLWVIVIAAIAVRLPFLLKGKGFFNSDEALEGLMALHWREWPVFFAGQGYKGVPEVYLYALAFGAFGMGVIQMKAVVLMLWAVATTLTGRLAFVWYGRTVAIVTAALVIVGTPALVYWSMSGNAEVAILTGLLALLLMLYRPDAARPADVIHPAVFTVLGFGLWIHPVMSCGAAALLLTSALERVTSWAEGWKRVRQLGLARDTTGAWRAWLLLLHVVMVLLLLGFAFGYLGGTFSLGILRVSHPQRSLRAIALVGFLILVSHAWAALPRRRVIVCLSALGIGLLPICVAAIRDGGVGTPVTSRYLADAPWMIAGVWREIVPSFVGIEDVGGGPLGLPWFTAAPLVFFAGVAAWRALQAAPRSAYQLYPFMAIGCAIALLVMGGAFSGAPSVRYLLPFWALFAMTAAKGIVEVARGRWALIAIGTALCLMPPAIGQYRWYSSLYDDAAAEQIVSCLRAHGYRVATADYWIAYRLTFLARQEVLVVPPLAEDRFGEYRRAIQPGVPVPVVEEGPPGGATHVVCEARPLRVILP